MSAEQTRAVEQIETFAHELTSVVRGEVKLDRLSRLLYSTDASSYQVMPAGVVLPRDADDVAAAIELAARHQIPIVPRGGGTSLSGQTVGRRPLR